MNEEATENETSSWESKNYGPGALGAFLGGLIGSVPWAFVYHMGYFVAWLGLVIGFLAKKGYELLGGKKGIGKIWIVCGATVFGVALGNVLPDFYEFAKLINSGEIPGKTYWDIPALYKDWAASYGLWPAILKNLALGLLFGLLGLSSLFKEMAAEVNTKLLQPQASGITEQNSAAPEESNPALQTFTVSYSGNKNILYGAVGGIVVLVVAGFVVRLFTSDGEPIDFVSLAIGMGSVLFFLALVGLPFFIYFRRLGKFKIDVFGDTLRIVPIWGKEMTVQFKDITNVAMFPGALANSDLSVVTVFFIKAYAGSKRLFNVNYGFVGARELLLRLKAEGIPFTAAITTL